MRGRMTVLMIFATSVQAGAEPAYCPADETVEVSGYINEIVLTDPAVPEIILEQASSKCTVDAIRIEGAVPGNCAEGGKAAAQGMIQQSGDGTWTWLNADGVKCE